MNDALDELLNPAAKAGHNIGPEDDQPWVAERIRKRVADLVATANRWATEPGRQVIADAETAGKCKDFLDQIAAERKAADLDRKAQNKPHDETIKAINAAFAPLLAMLDAVRDILAPRRTAWLIADQKRIDAEKAEADARAFAAIEAADKAKRDAEAALTKPGANAIEAQVAAHNAAAEAERAIKKADAAPVRAQVKGDFSQRARGLTTRWRWRIVSRSALPDQYWIPDEKAISIDVGDATKGLPHGSAPRATIPGIEIYSEQT